MFEQDMQEILFTEEQIKTRIQEMAAEITRDYADSPPVVVGVLRGCFVFLADLVRGIDLPIVIDFVSASSYGSGTVTSGDVKFKLDLSEDIAGRDVLVVEDILDTGNTLSKLMENLRRRGPKSVKLCVMLDKPDRRTRPIQADYVGYTIPDAFVVGCGLDYNQQYRQLPYVGVLKPEVYE